MFHIISQKDYLTRRRIFCIFAINQKIIVNLPYLRKRHSSLLENILSLMKEKKILVKQYRNR